MLGLATTRLILEGASFFSVWLWAIEIRFWSIRRFDFRISFKKLKSYIGESSGSNGMISLFIDFILLLSLLEFSDRIGSESFTAKIFCDFVS